MASHDLEDLLAVVDGCAKIVNEVHQSPANLKKYLATEFSELLKNKAFREALPGHLSPGSGDQDRVSLVMDRLNALAHEAP
jgi:hypothetical protein